MPPSSGSAPTRPASCPSTAGPTRSLGLLAGAAVAGLAGYATSFIIARFRHLPLIMITMGLGFLLHEAANSAEWLTGGSDGLQGVRKGTLLGVIAFDLYGYTAYAYALMRAVPGVPGGAAADQLAVRPLPARHPREPRAHARHRRAEPRAHPQDLHDLRRDRRHRRRRARRRRPRPCRSACSTSSARPRCSIILVLGGAGRLYGGLVGAIIFMVARDQFSGIAPQYWYFWIGALLVTVVMLLPNGVLGGLAHAHRGAGGARRREHATPALSTHGLDKRFGSLVVASDINLDDPARRALCADRPERRRQDHAHQPDHGHAAARRRQDPSRRCRHHRVQARRPRQARAGAHVPDQRPVPAPQRARGRDARRVRAARAWRAVWWKPLSAYADAVAEAYAILQIAEAWRPIATA